jgi:glycosyltransferase involved in cell wall biosynthesis
VGQRVVIVTRRFWPLVGGEPRRIASLAAELTARGCRAKVLTAQWNDRWPASILYRETPIVRLPPAPRDWWSTLRYERAIRRWLRQHQGEYDVVYVSGVEDEASAALQAAGRQVPVVLAADMADCRRPESFAARRTQKRSRAAAAILAPSTAMHRGLIEAGYPQGCIRCVSRGVFLPPLPTPETKALARDALSAVNLAFHVPPDTPLAVFVGRLDESRDLITLLAAWSTVVVRRPRARLWLIGEGPAHLAVRDQIETRGLSGRVLIAGMFDDPSEALAAADIAVVSAREPGSPLALLEAMAAGAAIVAADVAEHREMAGEGPFALFAPPGDSLAWSRALERILDQQALALRLGEAARRAAEDHSAARMAEEHLRLFEELSQRL